MKKRILFPLILAATLLGLFFLTRYGLPELRSPSSCWSRPLPHSPEWAARHVFWACALIIFLPSVFGKYRFSAAAFAGYPIGLAAGELFGGFQADVPPQYLHYGWLIFLCVFAAACLLGAILQHRAGAKS